jgi:NDP-sugar pyrophosphorylase family protein
MSCSFWTASESPRGTVLTGRREEKNGVPTKNIDTAFILAAGRGTRLRPLTENMPKPLLPIGGRPMITHAMEHLRAAGVRRFIVNTHHAAHKYAEAFPDGTWQGLPVVFRHEPVLLDTAGGLKNIEDLIAGEERIWVYNGDILTNLPLAPLAARHFALGTEATLALRSRGTPQNVAIDAAGYICDMRDLLGAPGAERCLFTGIYLLETAFLRRLAAGKIESIVLPLVASIRDNPRSIGGIVIDDGFWYDLGTIKEYNTLCGQIL